MARILLIEDPPVLPFGDRNAPQYLAFLGTRGNAEGRAWVRQEDAEEGKRSDLVLSEIASRSSCERIRTDDLYRGADGDSGGVKVMENHQLLYIDDDHLSVAGAMLALPRFREMLGDVVARTPPTPRASSLGFRLSDMTDAEGK